MYDDRCNSLIWDTESNRKTNSSIISPVLNYPARSGKYILK